MQKQQLTSSTVSVQNIKEAAHLLKDVTVRIPLMYNHQLSEQIGAKIWLKRKDLQVVRSYKIRGAYYKIDNHLINEITMRPLNTKDPTT